MAAKASVARGHAVAALVLELIEERGDEVGVEVADVELAGRLAGLGCGEGEQELEGVAVGGDGVRAGLQLPGQPLGEEGLQGGGEGAHGWPPRWASSRWPARPSSSGAADRYQ